MRRHRLAAALLACAAACAQAAPYAIRYEGEIAGSEFAGIANGQRFTVTFILDNGGASARHQAWTASHLTCAIWRMNDAADVVFTHDLAAHPLAPQDVTGTATSGASGALTGLFGLVRADAAVQPGEYAASGIALNGAVKWHADPANGSVFSDGIGTAGARVFHDSTGAPGLAMAPARWSAPARVMGACDDTPHPTPEPHPAAVPTLGHAALALLAGVIGAAGWAARRRV